VFFGQLKSQDLRSEQKSIACNAPAKTNPDFTPLASKFKSDLVRMIDLILAGQRDLVSSEHNAAVAASREITALPALKLADLSGHPLTADQLPNVSASSGGNWRC
jgi:hypothetical protein